VSFEIRRAPSRPRCGRWNTWIPKLGGDAHEPFAGCWRGRAECDAWRPSRCGSGLSDETEDHPARYCYHFLMRPAGKAVTAFLIALVVGATPLNVCARTADFPGPPQHRTIRTPTVRSNGELATESVLTRLLLSKRVDRRTSDSFGMPSRMDPPNPVHLCIRIAARHLAPESVARVSVRGRAPPV
jgi:hypothetical protein